MPSIKDAVGNLELAISRLKAMEKTYTIEEMQQIRKLILHTVRNQIDPFALGHAPEQRRY